MKNDFDTEAKEITDELKLTADYLDCEKVILHHLKMHAKEGDSDAAIEAYMKKLYGFFEAKIKSTQNKVDCVNDQYASGFLNTLMATSYWHIWVK